MCSGNTGISANEILSGDWAPVRTGTVVSQALDVSAAISVNVVGTGGVTIAALTSGQPGQIVTINNTAPGAGNVTLVNSATTLQLAGSTDLTLTPKSSVTLMMMNSVAPVLWREISRAIA